MAGLFLTGVLEGAFGCNVWGLVRTWTGAGVAEGAEGAAVSLYPNPEDGFDSAPAGDEDLVRFCVVALLRAGV